MGSVPALGWYLSSERLRIGKMDGDDGRIETVDLCRMPRPHVSNNDSVDDDGDVGDV